MKFQAEDRSGWDRLPVAFTKTGVVPSLLHLLIYT